MLSWRKFATGLSAALYVLAQLPPALSQDIRDVPVIDSIVLAFNPTQKVDEWCERARQALTKVMIDAINRAGTAVDARITAWFQGNMALIDNLEKAYDRQRTKTFADLDEAAKNNFLRASNLLSTATNDIIDVISTTNAALTSQFGQGTPIVTGYSPRIIGGNATGSRFTVVGYGLHGSDPRLVYEGRLNAIAGQESADLFATEPNLGKEARRIGAVPDRLDFIIPSEFMKANSGEKMIVHVFSLEYPDQGFSLFRWLLGRNSTEPSSKLFILQEPSQIGKLVVEGTRTSIERSERKSRFIGREESRGRGGNPCENSNRMTDSVFPVDGWAIEPESIQATEVRGCNNGMGPFNQAGAHLGATSEKQISVVYWRYYTNTCPGPADLTCINGMNISWIEKRVNDEKCRKEIAIGSEGGSALGLEDGCRITGATLSLFDGSAISLNGRLEHPNYFLMESGGKVSVGRRDLYSKFFGDVSQE